MGNLDDLLDRFLPKKKVENFIVHQEIIERNEGYLARFENWKEDHSSIFLQKIEKGYQAKLLNRDDTEVSVHILSSKYANGLAVTFDSAYISEEGFSFLFDFLAEKIKLMSYRLITSDLMISEKMERIEKKEKHYLKPIKSQNEVLINQRFGNILIEHILVDDKPNYLKLTANVYSDSKYQEPESFESLLKILFSDTK